MIFNFKKKPEQKLPAYFIKNPAQGHFLIKFRKNKRTKITNKTVLF